MPSGSKKRPKKSKHYIGSAPEAAMSFLKEAEKTAEVLAREVRHHFEGLAETMGHAAGVAAERTASVTRTSGQEAAHLIVGLAEEVKQAGEASLQAIGERFAALRSEVLSSVVADKAKKGPEEEKKKGKKASAVKRAAPQKKAVARKRAAAVPNKKAGPAVKRGAAGAVANRPAPAVKKKAAPAVKKRAASRAAAVKRAAAPATKRSTAPRRPIVKKM